MKEKVKTIHQNAESIESILTWESVTFNFQLEF